MFQRLVLIFIFVGVLTIGPTVLTHFLCSASLLSWIVFTSSLPDSFQWLHRIFLHSIGFLLHLLGCLPLITNWFGLWCCCDFTCPWTPVAYLCYQIQFKRLFEILCGLMRIFTSQQGNSFFNKTFSFGVSFSICGVGWSSTRYSYWCVFGLNRFLFILISQELASLNNWISLFNSPYAKTS